MPITREQLAAEAPEVLAAIRAEGATAERERIQAVENALIPGHEALIASLKFDGKTSGGDAALAVLGAERTLRAKAGADFNNDAPKPLPSAAAPAVDVPKAKPETDKSLPVEERCKATWEANAAIRAEFGTLATYTAYLRAEESGKVRVLKNRAA